MADEQLCDEEKCRRIATRYVISSKNGSFSIDLCDQHARVLTVYQARAAELAEKKQLERDRTVVSNAYLKSLIEPRG